MVDGEHIDPVRADDVEASVGEAAQGRPSYAGMRFGIGLGVTLDAVEAPIHGPQERLTQSREACFVPTERVVEIRLGPEPEG